MEWSFTPDQVVKGEVSYSLDDFRKDLAQEARLNLDYPSELWLCQAYDLIYDLCYWLATGRTFSDYVGTVAADAPLDRAVLAAVKDHMADNIAMLGAILQRMIMDGVEAGLPVEEAIAVAAQRHARAITAGQNG